MWTSVASWKEPEYPTCFDTVETHFHGTCINFSPKCWFPPTRLQVVRTQKATVLTHRPEKLVNSLTRMYLCLCGNKIPTRCNRGFHCRSYCLLNVSGTTMLIIRSSRLLYNGCCLWYLVLWFSSCCSGVELRVMCPVCRMLQHPANRTHNPQLHTRPATWKLLSSWWWA